MTTRQRRLAGIGNLKKLCLRKIQELKSKFQKEKEMKENSYIASLASFPFFIFNFSLPLHFTVLFINVSALLNASVMTGSGQMS